MKLLNMFFLKYLLTLRIKTLTSYNEGAGFSLQELLEKQAKACAPRIAYISLATHELQLKDEASLVMHIKTSALTC